jgi:hypothetical protein
MHVDIWHVDMLVGKYMCKTCSVDQPIDGIYIASFYDLIHLWHDYEPQNFKGWKGHSWAWLAGL